MENLVIIPAKELKAILDNQNKILKLLENISIDKTQKKYEFNYLKEEDAKKILGKKSTWFWKQRTEGKLSYSKIGNSIFYKRTEIEKLFDDNLLDKF